MEGFYSHLSTLRSTFTKATSSQTRKNTLKETVSHMAKVLSAPIVISCGEPPITLESSTATTPPSCAYRYCKSKNKKKKCTGSRTKTIS